MCYFRNIAYMQSEKLLESDDEGMAHLLTLNDVVNRVIFSAEMPTVGSCDGDVNANHCLSTMSPQQITQSHSEQEKNTHAQTNPQPHIHTNTQSVEELRKMYDQLGEQLRLCEVAAPSPAILTRLQGESPSHTTPTPSLPERVVPSKDMHYLPRREFKVHGGQIGDQSSEVSFNCISKQMDEGLKEGFGEAEVIRGVLRVMKPGTFRDMLVNKEEMTVSELKGFLRSHLGEKATTEMFQELMCARQLEQESPQQFLYRMIGLKQKLLFQSKQANADISYDPKTIQEVFLHSVYQGLGSKHSDIRQGLKPLISNSQLTDEEILGQVMKMINDENEHQRRIGQLPRQSKTTHSHAARVEASGDCPKDKPKCETTSSDSSTIQQLAAQVETLTQMMATLMEKQMGNIQASYRPPAQKSPHPQFYAPQPPPHRYLQPTQSQEGQPGPSPQPPPNQCPQPPPLQERRRYRCPECTDRNREGCNHCFVCGEAGHRAVGCSKRSKPQGNGNRFQPRDNLRPGYSYSPKH